MRILSNGPPKQALTATIGNPFLAIVTLTIESIIEVITTIITTITNYAFNKVVLYLGCYCPMPIASGPVFHPIPPLQYPEPNIVCYGVPSIGAYLE